MKYYLGLRWIKVSVDTENKGEAYLVRWYRKREKKKK